MPIKDNTCPHCGSQHSRLLNDHLGSVGWCSDCHHAWILVMARPVGPKSPRHPAPERQRYVA